MKKFVEKNKTRLYLISTAMVLFVLILFTAGCSKEPAVEVINGTINFPDFQENKIPEKGTLEFPEYVCDNLDNGKSVYYEVIKSKTDIENNLQMRVINIYGNETSARMWNTLGVTCNMAAEVCQKQYLFCFNIQMIVPVDYNEWDMWFNKNMTVPIIPENSTISLNGTNIINNTKGDINGNISE